MDRDWKLLSKAQKYEKTNLKKAISIYETFVFQKARYPLPYLRLPVIYHRKKDFYNEVRVLEAAICVFERDGDDRNLADAQTKLQKALLLAQPKN